ncbi:MAG: cytosine deaminase [Alphaproteobacteria bacterium]|jgi:cytosine deaminase
MDISLGIEGSALNLTNLKLPDGREGAIFIRNGVIVSGGESPVRGKSDAAICTIDCDGALALPGLVDGHMHLDKTLFGTSWFSQQAGPTRQSRIDTEKRLRAELPPVSVRARNLVEACIAQGTTAIRTHVDIDPENGLSALRDLCVVRDEFLERIDIQIVAFPQSGILCCPGVAELLSAAMTAGADLLGGIDPIAMDGGADGQLDVIFEIAAAHDAGVDIHLHDSGADGLREIMGVTARASALGAPGRVTISHGFALGAAGKHDFETAAAAMADAGVSLATHGGGASVAPPVKALRERGVAVFAGSDNIRDLWSPYGNGDMLERAMLLGWRCGFRNDEDLAIALDCASGAGARALGAPRHGLAPGDPADLFTIKAECSAEAVVSHPQRELVIKRGRIVAAKGVLIEN